MMDNKNSYLVKIFGLYRLDFACEVGKLPEYFILMECLRQVSEKQI